MKTAHALRWQNIVNETSMEADMIRIWRSIWAERIKMASCDQSVTVCSGNLLLFEAGDNKNWFSLEYSERQDMALCSTAPYTVWSVANESMARQNLNIHNLWRGNCGIYGSESIFSVHNVCNVCRKLCVFAVGLLSFHYATSCTRTEYDIDYASREDAANWHPFKMRALLCSLAQRITEQLFMWCGARMCSVYSIIGAVNARMPHAMLSGGRIAHRGTFVFYLYKLCCFC